jgi:hypothetical protein
LRYLIRLGVLLVCGIGFSTPALSSKPPVEPVVDSTDINPRIPYYQQIRPQWGVELGGAAQSLGDSPSIPDLGDAKLRAISLRFEYQPSFLQGLGVFSLGPSLTAYPVIPKTSLTRPIVGIWSVGGQIRYQARYFREQPIVPVAGYSYERLSYSLASGTQGSFITKGAFFGGMLLLNIFDPGTTAQFFLNYKVTKSYLLAELHTYSGGDSNITVSGRSVFFGLRFEF